MDKINRVSFNLVDKDFGQIFLLEKDRIRNLLGVYSDVHSIKHFGSTSVPDLSGKGIIDIMIVLNSFDSIKEIVTTLQKGGLYYKETAGSAGRIFLSDQPLTSVNVKFHYHLVKSGTHDHLDPLIFRDALRANKSLAHEYQELKRNLSQSGLGPREYQAGKSDFICGVVFENKKAL